MSRRILHIDLDAFFVSVERIDRPDLRGVPVIVGGDPGSRGVVACASYEARPYGLRAGMSLAQARRLCPQAFFLPGRFHRYSEVSRRFMDVLGDFTPDLEPLGLDEAYLDMTGFELMYGPAAEVAMRIKERIRTELRITASVGIASSKVVAKVASDHCKPDGLLEVPLGGEAAFLAPLEVRKLPGVGAKTEQALHRLGVRTIGDLAALPERVLRYYFGVMGDALRRCARGEGTGHVHAPEPPKSISRETTFGTDVADRGFLRSVLRYLTERVGASLRREGKWARTVTCKVRYGDFQTVIRHRTLRRATASDDVVYAEASALLARALAQRRTPVRLIGVGVKDLVRGAQMPLFDGPAERDMRLCAALDSIRARHGFLAIQTGRTLPLGAEYDASERGYVLHTPSLSR